MNKKVKSDELNIACEVKVNHAEELVITLGENYSDCLRR
jgi:hypothetical protein